LGWVVGGCATVVRELVISLYPLERSVQVHAASYVLSRVPIFGPSQRKNLKRHKEKRYYIRTKFYDVPLDRLFRIRTSVLILPRLLYCLVPQIVTVRK